MRGIVPDFAKDLRGDYIFLSSILYITTLLI